MCFLIFQYYDWVNYRLWYDVLKWLYIGIAVGNLCYMKYFDLVFLLVVCKSRSGIHFKLLKSDNICSFYTNLNIEKIGSCFGGKTIITDIWNIGHLSFHSSEREKNMYIDPFLLFCLPFNICPINNKIKLDIQCVFGRLKSTITKI
jgi:hypothetical protein